MTFYKYQHHTVQPLHAVMAMDGMDNSSGLINVKSFPSHMAHRAVLISVSIALVSIAVSIVDLCSKPTKYWSSVGDHSLTVKG